MATKGTSDKFDRSRSLDGLRGMAAVAVIFYHAFLHNSSNLLDVVLPTPIYLLRSTRDVLSKLALSISNGEVAVHIFFVLSGFVLFLSLKRRSSSISPVMLSIQFAIARLMRLYPAVIVCMAVFYGLSVVLKKIGISGFPVFQFRSFLENASLFNISMHGPSTTVQVEVLAIPFILSAYFVTRAFALPGAILCFVYSIYATDGGWWVLFMPNMHGYLLSFIAGIIVADDSIGAAFAKAPPGLWWGVIIVLLAGRAILPPGIPSLVSMTLTSALLVGGLYHGQSGSLSRLLSSAPALLLGKVSYSLYLLNVIFLYMVWAFTDQLHWMKGHEIEVGLLVSLCVLTVSVPLSYLMLRWVEEPGIAVGRKLTETLARWDSKPRQDSLGQL